MNFDSGSEDSLADFVFIYELFVSLGKEEGFHGTDVRTINATFLRLSGFAKDGTSILRVMFIGG